MTPRIPVPDVPPTASGAPDVSSLCPPMHRAFSRSYRAVRSVAALDPVTAELVRLRNATVRDCFT